MILKTLTHDRGQSDCWNWYDNIESASAYFDESADEACIALRFKDSSEEIVIAITDIAYLCNDHGQTIEKLLPKKRDSIRSAHQPKFSGSGSGG